MENKGEILIYQSGDLPLRVEVKFEKETVWLTQKQMATLFEKDSDTIGLHLKNIYAEAELEEDPTTEFFSVVQAEGKRKVQRKIAHYNLDAIISVGYRVNSKRGTQFRQWATQRLKDYLTKGYALNEQRLRASEERFLALKKSMELLENVAQHYELSADEAVSLLKVVAEYAQALDLLDQYDHQRLSIPPEEEGAVNPLHYDEAIFQIAQWRAMQGAGRLFGNEKDESFNSSLEAIYQTFDGKDLYPTTKEKAANLLYFVVKNHSFSDGNKRIAAGLFVYFLDKNNLLYDQQRRKIIADNALVAITMMVAESDPEEKEMMIKLIANLMVKS